MKRFSVLLLLSVGAVFSLLAACGPAGDQAPTDDVDVTITLVNEGSTAWLVTNDGGAGVAELDTPNPEWRLVIGERYRVNNNSGPAHPLVFLDRQGRVLLSQQRAVAGALEGDTEVAYLEDDAGVTFTFTQTLADAVAEYICAFHSEMRGSVGIFF